jgi:hypothetical protein
MEMVSVEDQLAPSNRFADLVRQEWDRAGRPSVRELARQTRKKAGAALSHGMIYSTLRGNSLPSSWENAQRVIEVVLDYAGERGPGRDALVASCRDIYLEENQKRAVMRSALHQGADARRRVNHAPPAQDQPRPDAGQGPFSEAIQQAEVVVDQRTRDLGLNHPDTLDARQQLAYWTGKNGSPATAAALLAELASDRERVLGPDHPATLNTRHAHAYWTGTAGHPDEAARLLQDLVIDRSRVLGSNHELTQRTRQNVIAWTSTMARCQAG